MQRHENVSDYAGTIVGRPAVDGAVGGHLDGDRTTVGDNVTDSGTLGVAAYPDGRCRLASPRRRLASDTVPSAPHVRDWLHLQGVVVGFRESHRKVRIYPQYRVLRCYGADRTIRITIASGGGLCDL